VHVVSVPATAWARVASEDSVHRARARSNATVAQPAAAPSVLKITSSTEVVRPCTASCVNSIETENANPAATATASFRRCRQSAAPKGRKRSRFPTTPTKVMSLNGRSLSWFGASCGHKVTNRISTTAASKTTVAGLREARSKDGRIRTARAYDLAVPPQRSRATCGVGRVHRHAGRKFQTRVASYRRRPWSRSTRKRGLESGSPAYWRWSWSSASKLRGWPRWSPSRSGC